MRLRRDASRLAAAAESAGWPLFSCFCCCFSSPERNSRRFAAALFRRCLRSSAVLFRRCLRFPAVFSSYSVDTFCPELSVHSYSQNLVALNFIFFLNPGQSRLQIFGVICLSRICRRFRVIRGKNFPPLHRLVFLPESQNPPFVARHLQHRFKSVFSSAVNVRLMPLDFNIFPFFVPIGQFRNPDPHQIAARHRKAPLRILLHSGGIFSDITHVGMMIKRRIGAFCRTSDAPVNQNVNPPVIPAFVVKRIINRRFIKQNPILSREVFALDQLFRRQPVALIITRLIRPVAMQKSV